MFLYGLSVLYLPWLLAKRNFLKFCKIRKLIATGGNEDKSLREKINDMSVELRIRTPIVVVWKTDKIDARSSYIGFPYFRNILIITETTFEELHEDELEGLIAHEMWHIKRHTLKLKMLNILSEWTFMGSWYLASLFNSVKMEFKADDFAVSWLNKRGIEKEVFADTLRKIQIHNAFAKTNEIISREVGITDNDTKNYAKPSPGKKTFLNQFRNSLALSLEDEILSYIYPSIEERISRITGKEYGT